MDTIQTLFQYAVHIDLYLINFVATYGIFTYFALFVVIFCETGLVIFPFLPGDSLLFTAGSLAAHESGVLNIQLLFILLTCASIFGNKVNYLTGKYLGPRLFCSSAEKGLGRFLFNKKYLEEAHRFYEKHGGKTIIFARYIPIIRSFAPFVAGMGYMSLKAFSFYNIASAVLWVGSMLAAGYFFGQLPFIQEHFSIVIYGIIGFSLLPPIIAFIYRKAFTIT